MTTDNLRHAQYGSDGVQVDDPQTLLRLTDAQTQALGADAGRFYAPRPTGNAATDFEALLELSAALPAYAVVSFPAGATYTVAAGWWKPKDKQIWRGDRTIIKRANETATTSLGTTVNGALSINVTSTTGWRVGMYVCIGDAARTVGRSVSSSRVLSVGIGLLNLDLALVITDNVGTVVTSLPAGSIVASKGAMFGNREGSLLNECTIAGFEIDGNVSNNPNLNWWAVQTEIDLCANDGRLFELQVHDTGAEGIVVSGRSGIARDVRINNSGGNGFHLSDYNGTLGAFDWKLFNVISDTSATNTGVGHRAGGIIASNNVLRTTLTDCETLNSQLTGVASWDSALNAYAEIKGLRSRNNLTGAFAISTSAGQVASKVRIIGGEMINCGTDETTLGQLTTINSATEVEVVGVYFEDCPVIVRADNSQVASVNFSSNNFIASASFTGKTYITALLDIQSDNVTVNGGNTFSGGFGTTGLLDGVRVNGTRKDVHVIGNTFRGLNRHIYLNGSNYSSSYNNAHVDWFLAAVWENNTGALTAGAPDITVQAHGTTSQVTASSTAGAVIINKNAGSKRTRVRGSKINIEKTAGNTHHGLLCFSTGQVFVEDNEITVVHASSSTINTSLCSTAGSVVAARNKLSKAAAYQGAESLIYDSVNGAAVTDSNRVY